MAQKLFSSVPQAALVAVGLCCATIGLTALPQPAAAQFYSPSFLAPKVAPSGEILEVANALGMVRGPGRNLFDAINRVQFAAKGHGFQPHAQGAWTRYEVPRAVIGISYHLAAVRSDVTQASGGREQRTIHVVAGPNAWNEQSPGVGAAPAMAEAKARARDLWMTPHGFLGQAMRLGPGAVAVGKRGAKTTLSFELEGERLTAVLGADKRPERIEAQITDPVLGATTLAMEYSDYKDFDHYAIQWPSRWIRKLGDRVVLDLTVQDFRTGPYLSFPPPAQLQSAAATSTSSQ